ncbi:AAA domain-containing protein [Paraphysoderma sedebokerense]|nr:AAA domain-containing protein [Paraphysoderma sedebokerense]
MSIPISTSALPDPLDLSTVDSAPGTPYEDSGLVSVICLTGGPCGGKSTVQSMLSDVLENMGYKVYRVPETATILLGCGVTFGELDHVQQFSFQESILRVMLHLEQTFIDLAHLNAKNLKRKTVVLCDRGTMDPSAYIDRPGWLRILGNLKLKEVEIRDNRYDCVVHLVTAADGAEAFYQNENNNIRSEGIELARQIDSVIKNAWIGHPYYTIIDNTTNFDKKCHRVIEAVLKRFGLSDKRWGSGIRKHKFLVKNFNHTSEFPVPYRDFNVEHRYLLNSTEDGSQSRIRKRADSSGTCHYNITIRRPEKEGQRVEERRSLSAREYDALKLQSDPTRLTINKLRRCFQWKNRYFQLDLFQTACAGLTLLEAYIDQVDNGADILPNGAGDVGGIKAEGDHNVENGWDRVLPSFIEIEREVTDDPAFSMFELAKKDDLDKTS